MQTLWCTHSEKRQNSFWKKEVIELHIRKKFFIYKEIQESSHPQSREKDLRFTERLPLTQTGSYMDMTSLSPHCSVIPSVQNNKRTQRCYRVYSRSQSKDAAEKMQNQNLSDQKPVLSFSHSNMHVCICAFLELILGKKNILNFLGIFPETFTQYLLS